MVSYEDDEIALCYGAILRDSIRHQVVARYVYRGHYLSLFSKYLKIGQYINNFSCFHRYVLESEHFKKFFGYIQNPNFEIASDAATTFKVKHLEMTLLFVLLIYDSNSNLSV